MPTFKWGMSKHWRMTRNEHMTKRNTKLCDILSNKRDRTKIKLSHDLYLWKWPFIFCSLALVLETHDWRIGILISKCSSIKHIINGISPLVIIEKIYLVHLSKETKKKIWPSILQHIILTWVNFKLLLERGTWTIQKGK